MTQLTDVPSPARSSARTALWSGLFLLGFPFLATLVCVVKTSYNAPLTDDYDCIADFILPYTHLHGALARIDWILNSQHNEYKLILLHSVVAFQYHLIGHINYRALQLIGDLAIPAALWLLWLFLTRQQRPFQQNIWLILVPWYLFLGLPYWETVNWAMNGFFAQAIIPFSLATVLFFTSPARYATLWGALFLVLSIAANASGVLLAVAVLILLISQRRFRAAGVAAVAASIMVGIYRYHYITIPHPQAPLSAGITFALAFLGGICPTLLSSTALGVILVAGFVFLLSRGWVRSSPDTFCIALFCLLTAAALVRGRAHEGVETAMSGRYRVFPVLLLSVEYLATLRVLVPQRLALRSRWTGAIALASLAAIVFGISSGIHAYRQLHQRQRVSLAHLILWERHPGVPGLVSPYPLGDRFISFRLRAQPILAQNIGSGLYIPPVSAQDTLPVKPHSELTLGFEDEPPPAKTPRHP